MKSSLTPHERIRVAFLHYCEGMPQEQLAIAFSVNGGRINEACKAIEKAARFPKRVRAYKEGLPAAAPLRAHRSKAPKRKKKRATKK